MNPGQDDRDVYACFWYKLALCNNTVSVLIPLRHLISPLCVTVSLTCTSGKEGLKQGTITECSDFKQICVYDWTEVRGGIRQVCECEFLLPRAQGWQLSVAWRVLSLVCTARNMMPWITQYSTVVQFIFSEVLVAALPQGPKCRITEWLCWRGKQISLNVRRVARWKAQHKWLRCKGKLFNSRS